MKHSIQHTIKHETVIEVNECKGYKQTDNDKLDSDRFTELFKEQTIEQNQTQFRCPKSNYVNETDPFSMRTPQINMKFKALYTKGDILEDGTITPLIIEFIKYIYNMKDLKDKVAIANKKYRELNKDKILIAKRAIYLRDRLILGKFSCNTLIGIKALHKHMKSRKHSDALMKQFLNV